MTSTNILKILYVLLHLLFEILPKRVTVESGLMEEYKSLKVFQVL